MALKKDVVVRGVPIAGAVIRVYSYEGFKERFHFGVSLSPSATDPAFHCEQYSTDLDPKGGTPLVQAYAYLKTLPEFAGAVDC